MHCALALSAISMATGCSSDDAAGLSPDDLPRAVCTSFAPSGTVTGVVRRGPLCTLLGPLVCQVQDADLAIDGQLGTAAKIRYTLGLLDGLTDGAIGLELTLPGPVSAGRLAAFEVGIPGSTLELSLARNISVTTTMNGQPVESGGFGENFELDVLGISVAGGSRRELIGFVTSAPYNGIEITLSSDFLSLDVSDGIRVFEYCNDARPRR